MATSETAQILDRFTVLEQAVLYARVSGDDRGKEGRNLAGQLDDCREFAGAKGYKIVAELAEDDRGASGYEIDLPQLNKVREMAQAGNISVLVVRELDRLSRNLAKQLIVEEELRRAGVRIEYVLAEYDDSPEGRLQKHIRATVAEYEREKIKERMVRGRRKKVAKGKVMVYTRPPYGYRVQHDQLVIYEPEAGIVRLIFELYVNKGLTMGEIAAKLDKMGAPLPNGIKKNTMGWGTSTIHRMLKNETYAGVWYYGKTNKHQKKKNPREQWIAVDVPAIVAESTFARAQARIEHNKRTANNQKYEYLLAGHTRCACCGNSFRGHYSGKALYYKPPRGKKAYLKQCTLPLFRVDLLDTAVWHFISSFLGNKKVRQETFARYREKQAERFAPLKERLATIDKLLAENRAQLERLLDIYLTGELPRDMLVERKNRLETTVNALEKERAAISGQIERDTLTDEQIQDIETYIEKIGRGLELANANFAARRKIIELLDVQVTLAVENEEKIAYVQCKLLEDTKRLALSALPRMVWLSNRINAVEPGPGPR